MVEAGEALHLSCEHYPPALPSPRHLLATALGSDESHLTRSSSEAPTVTLLATDTSDAKKGRNDSMTSGNQRAAYPGAWFEMQLDQIFSLILEICRKSGGSPILVLQCELGQNSNSLLILKKKKSSFYASLIKMVYIHTAATVFPFLCKGVIL